MPTQHQEKQGVILQKAITTIGCAHHEDVELLPHDKSREEYV
jgi:hypothetical protein